MVDISTGMVTDILIVKILPTVKVELRIRLGKVRGATKLARAPEE
jgi:hypothetical protein